MRFFASYYTANTGQISRGGGPMKPGNMNPAFFALFRRNMGNFFEKTLAIPERI